MRVNQITAVLVMAIIAAAIVAMQSLPKEDEMNTFQQPMLPPSSTIYTGNITLPQGVIARFDTTSGSAAVTATLPGSPAVGDACGMALIDYAAAVSTTAFTLTKDTGGDSILTGAAPKSAYYQYVAVGLKTGVQSQSVDITVANNEVTNATITAEIGLGQGSAGTSLAGTIETKTSVVVPAESTLDMTYNIGDALDALTQDGTYNASGVIYLNINVTANTGSTDLSFQGINANSGNVALNEEAPLLRYINSSRNGNLLDGGTTEDQLTAIGDMVMYQFLGSSLGWKRYPYMVSE